MSMNKYIYYYCCCYSLVFVPLMTCKDEVWKPCSDKNCKTKDQGVCNRKPNDENRPDESACPRLAKSKLTWFELGNGKGSPKALSLCSSRKNCNVKLQKWCKSHHVPSWQDKDYMLLSDYQNRKCTAETMLRTIGVLKFESLFLWLDQFGF